MFTRVRNTVTGRFVKAKEAVKHPKRTVVETYKEPKEKYIIFGIDVDTMTLNKIYGTSSDFPNFGPSYEIEWVSINTTEEFMLGRKPYDMYVPRAVRYLDSVTPMPEEEQKYYDMAWYPIP